MAYDDIANNSRNPFPGQIFNQPDGVDVYAGCNIDYSGKDVTPDNFLAVLKGDAAAVATAGNGKVLKSDANSKVFINFADHGAVGLVAFPDEVLYADDLNAALKYMHKNAMYDQLVFYLEACESGSMFEGLLPANLNIYATTAANAQESSYAAYCSPDDMVNKKHVGSCLGDQYSVSWMEDSDAKNDAVETLAQQFKLVKKETAQLSHVMEYGTTTFKNEVTGDFQGDLDLMPASMFQRLLSKAIENPVDNSVNRERSAVSSRDAKLSHLYSQILHNPSHMAHLELQEELTHRMKVDHIFETIAEEQYSLENTDFPLPRNFACLKNLVRHTEDKCGKFSDYSLKYVKYLVRECENLVSEGAVDGVMHRINRACGKQ